MKTTKRSYGNVHDYGHKGEVHHPMTPMQSMKEQMAQKKPRQAEQMAVEDPGDVS